MMLMYVWGGGLVPRFADGDLEGIKAVVVGPADFPLQLSLKGGKVEFQVCGLQKITCSDFSWSIVVLAFVCWS